MIWSLNDELDESVARPPSGSRHLCSKRGGGDDRGEGEGMQEGADNQNSVTFWTNPTYGEVPPPLPALLLFHPTRQIPTPWGQQLTPKDVRVLLHSPLPVPLSHVPSNMLPLLQ
ncbi:hypothetical protein Pst134EA_022551 [Puccinia striiformis f. sp. tritici]|uniref:hypothetical protein n=1 Tax=Puccinia striiformis f. sp. tritici TaxID=168172 RepID=UPI002007A026|nr:hypothetical protein Pst134EA_022551 [Puccinia striiformis f. sp. tritici]KAH9445608.1 hypothetical protein Pst134EB_023444 [Puccinia striiformis f. sp. tritici]KAH9455075.1 hypothetical protein Pst134EA_022551 [Puccinia striiformis f. sp. tritici]